MKKNVKMFFSALLCVVILFSLFSTTVFAEEKKPAFSIKIDDDVVVGEEVCVYIGLENMTAISQADVLINFDASSLEILEMRRPVTPQSDMWVTNLREVGKAFFSVAFADKLKGDFQIGFITFKVLNTENTVIEFCLRGCDGTEKPENAQFDLQQTEISDNATVNYELYYEIINSEVKITGCNTDSYGEIVIPDTIEGYPVTTIGEHAFSRPSDVTSVIIPDSVKTLEKNAFSTFSSLVNVVIGSGVRNIGEYTFWSCRNLKTVVFKDGPTYIPKEMFAHCNELKSVKLPDTLKTIGESAFSHCTFLSDTELPSDLEKIEKYAFRGCGSFQTINIPVSVTEIGVYALGFDSSLELMRSHTIYGKKGSVAEQYATKYGVTFSEVEISAIGKYDVNGDGKITAADARLALRVSAKLTVFEDTNSFFAADIDSNGKITAADARAILRKSAGLA